MIHADTARGRALLVWLCRCVARAAALGHVATGRDRAVHFATMPRAVGGPARLGAGSQSVQWRGGAGALRVRSVRAEGGGLPPGY